MTLKEAWDAIARAETEGLGDHLTFATIEPILSALAASPGIAEKVCARCGAAEGHHCDLDEPGLDHPSDCEKMHHEFKPKSAPGIAEKDIQGVTGDKPAGSHEADLEGRAGKPRAADAQAPAVGTFVPTEDAGARPAPELVQGIPTPAVIAEVVKDLREMLLEAGESYSIHLSAAQVERLATSADRLASLLPQEGK